MAKLLGLYIRLRSVPPAAGLALGLHSPAGFRPRYSAREYSFALIALSLLAAVFYFWQLSRPDIITDESSYAVRAIGMVDFDFGIEQPTPWQWVDAVPWWMRLSFHDHPPLVFLLQHYSIRAFGETPFAIRLPSVVAGIAAVFLVYLIGRQLYSPTVGLASSALFAFTVNHVWISRIGLQESIAIVLSLASAYFFLRGMENPKRLPWAGAFLGLAFLTKYHSLILIPIFFTISLIYNYLRDRVNSCILPLWAFLAAAAAFLIIASPIIVYNVQLYRNFGHFDFQFSQLFGQDVAAWPSHPGQGALGSYGERIRTYIPRLIEANSPYFLIISAAGLTTILWQLIRRSKSLVISHLSFVTVLAWLLPFLIFIGPAHRFLSLLTPWLAIAAGYAAVTLVPYRRAAAVIVVAIVMVEALYAYSSVIALDPIGSQPWVHSYLRRQAHSWGFNELNGFLDRELAGRMPDPAITFEFPFAKDVLEQAVAEGRARGLEPAPVAIVYNDNINLSASLWVFLRRIVYNGWPVVSAENFRSGGAAEFLRQAGVEEAYFINPTASALQDRTKPPTQDGDILEAELKAKGLKPKEIKNSRGEVAFRVYQFKIQ